MMTLPLFVEVSKNVEEHGSITQLNINEVLEFLVVDSHSSVDCVYLGKQP